MWRSTSELENLPASYVIALGTLSNLQKSRFVFFVGIIFLSIAHTQDCTNIIKYVANAKWHTFGFLVVHLQPNRCFRTEIRPSALHGVREVDCPHGLSNKASGRVWHTFGCLQRIPDPLVHQRLDGQSAVTHVEECLIRINDSGLSLILHLIDNHTLDLMPWVSQPAGKLYSSWSEWMI